MREWVLVSRYAGMTLAEYQALSFYQRFRLHVEVKRHREAILGAAPLNPEEAE